MRIQLVSDKVSGALKKLENKFKNTYPLRQSIGQLMKASVLRNFRGQRTPSGNSWPALSDLTKEMRRKGKGSGSMKPLRDTGFLMASIKGRPDGKDEVVVTANRKADKGNANIAAVHNFGANIKVTKKMRAWFHYQDVHLKKSTKKIRIPAREFMGIDSFGIKEIDAAIKKFYDS